MTPRPLHVCTFENRRSQEMSNLISRFGGIPVNAPSMREISLGDNQQAFDFADRLLAGDIQHVIFMTGIGTQALFEALAVRNLVEPVLSALARCTIIVRGPKPVAVLNKLGVRIDIRAPEPNTWRQIITAIESASLNISGQTVAVQEYGQPNVEMYRWLEHLRARVLPVPIYKWALPDDIAPLREAIRQTVRGELDVLLWTSAQQVAHAFQIADEMHLAGDWPAAANKCVIGSIGPTCSDRLREFGLLPDLEPSHPKMAHLVRETLEASAGILSRKRPEVAVEAAAVTV